MGGKKIAFNEHEFVPSEWKYLGRNDDGDCDVYTNGLLNVYAWDDGTWSVMEDGFSEVRWYESGETYADAISNWVDDMLEGLYSVYGSRRIASDGWSQEKCRELLVQLGFAEDLAYEIRNSRRGVYVPYAGDTYASLAGYARKLGEYIIAAADDIDYMYGAMSSEDIDFDDDESEEW